MKRFFAMLLLLCGLCAIAAAEDYSSMSMATLQALRNRLQTELDAIDRVIDARLSAVQNVGDTVFLGTYEQDGNDANGAEPIEWIVLDIRDGKALLLSRYCLDSQPYQTDGYGSDWNSSYMRVWLNEAFLTAAFTSQEADRLATGSTDKMSFEDFIRSGISADRVFLLTREEIIRFDARKAMPTIHLYLNGSARGGFTDNGDYYMNLCTKEGMSCSGYSNGFGAIYPGVHYAVRPAVWMTITAK